MNAFALVTAVAKGPNARKTALTNYVVFIALATVVQWKVPYNHIGPRDILHMPIPLYLITGGLAIRALSNMRVDMYKRDD